MRSSMTVGICLALTVAVFPAAAATKAPGKRTSTAAKPAAEKKPAAATTAKKPAARKPAAKPTE